MLPRKAVIYYQDIIDRTFAKLTAENSGMEVIAEVFEADPDSNASLGEFLQRTWTEDNKEEVIFPYTLILYRSSLLTDRFRKVILRNVIGVVNARETWPLLIDPDEFGIPVCPNLGDIATSFLVDGKETICPHIYDGGSEPDLEGTERGCRYEGEVAVCPIRADFDDLFREREDFLEKMKRRNFRTLVLHFFDLRGRLEKWEEGDEGMKPISESVRAHKIFIFEKMCAWLDEAERSLSHEEIVDKLCQERIYTTRDGETEFDMPRLSKLLKDIDKGKEWKALKRLKDARRRRRLHPH